MDVYFLRHGQSLFNLNEENDLIDCSLTSEGIQQSINISFNLFPKYYSFILCSPLLRCIQTLIYSNINFDQYEINDLCREIRSGCKSDLLHENEQILIENEQEIQQRISQLNNYLLELKQLNYKNLLIVSHADLIWNLTSKEINGELFGVWLNNCELFYWKTI